jgi:endonuclease YncB( thermonuclease family)
MTVCRAVIRSWLVGTLWLGAQAAIAAELSGVVVGLADGDTVTVLDATQQQHKVRLAGIDAPERHQAFGDRSTQHLASLVFRKKRSSGARPTATAESWARYGSTVRTLAWHRSKQAGLGTTSSSRASSLARTARPMLSRRSKQGHVVSASGSIPTR